MINRGIHDTKADWWCHFFPHEKTIYSYVVRHMQEWLKDHKPVEIIGRSKDGTETGKGYIVPKSSPFIRPVMVPDNMIEQFDWANATDRQAGLLWGEQVLDWMLATGRMNLPYFRANKLTKKTEQMSFGDFGLQFQLPEVLLIEVKTEQVRSNNLFVQTMEGGHRVHQRKQAGRVVEHFVKAQPLF